MEKIEAYKRLAEIKSRGVDVSPQIKELARYSKVPESVVSFIRKNNIITEADKFFENLRVMHNEKNHKLYPNLLNENLSEIDKLKCLSSYLTSACIAMESLENPSKVVELRNTICLAEASEALADYYSGRDFNKLDEALAKIRCKLQKFF